MGMANWALAMETDKHINQHHDARMHERQMRHVAKIKKMIKMDMHADDQDLALYL